MTSNSFHIELLSPCCDSTQSHDPVSVLEGEQGPVLSLAARVWRRCSCWGPRGGGGSLPSGYSVQHPLPSSTRPPPTSSLPLQKSPVVYHSSSCNIEVGKIPFKSRVVKNTPNKSNPLKMQILLTLISNIYTYTHRHAFTHANE